MNAQYLNHPYRDTALGIAVAVFVLAGTTGCKVKVDKTGDGDNVKIATPFGNIAVNKDQATPADLGLPAYPGAVPDSDHDGNESAKVDMGFGSFKLRVRVAHYATNDSRDRVLDFYRKALSEYGEVIECAGNKAMGTPASNGQGLSCDDSKHEEGVPNRKLKADDIELKAGSERHQHIVVVKGKGSATTQFSMIALDLPHVIHSGDQGTN